MAEVSETMDLLILGSGPAGYTAAIYAARAELSPVLYTGVEAGGQLMETTEVENYPGYAEGVMGPKMMEEFKQQAERFNTDVRFGHATEVDFSSQPYKVTIDDEKVVAANSIIISTGAGCCCSRWRGYRCRRIPFPVQAVQLCYCAGTPG